MVAVGATPAVIKARDKCKVPGVVDAFNALVERLRDEPRFVRPDKRTIWAKAWPDIPNHRHADLPGAWRCCWTIRRIGDEDEATILFLGSHESYERQYGFKER